MKLFRFKKEFASYPASRSGDDTLDGDFVLVFSDEKAEDFTHGGDYRRPMNNNLVWAYRYEVDEVDDKKLIEFWDKEFNKDVELILGKRKPGKGGLGCFAFKDKKNEMRASYNIPCHASFNGAGMIDACTWNTFLLKDNQKEIAREMVEWIVNFSPWLHCIASRWDILSAQERTDRAMNGPTPVNMEAPANEVAGFAVAMRTITEHSWVIPTYKKLRDLGASKAVAFMLTGFVQHVGEDDSFVYYLNSDWHHYLHHNQHVTDVCKFFKEGYHVNDRSLHKFNERKYNRVAGQIATYKGGEGSFDFFMGKHQKNVGAGWNVHKVLNIQAIINEVNEIWSKA